MTLDDSTIPNKISCYTPDLLPAAIYISSNNSVITLTIPCDSLKVTLLDSDYLATDHIVIVEEHDSVNVKIIYCTMGHDGREK